MSSVPEFMPRWVLDCSRNTRNSAGDGTAALTDPPASRALSSVE
jgi:hypothetical protein